MVNDQQNQSTEEATPISDFFFGSKQYRKAIQDEFAARSAAANLSSAQSNVAQQQLELVSQELTNLKVSQNKTKVWEAIKSATENNTVEGLNFLINDPDTGKAFKNVGITAVEKFNPYNEEHIQAYKAAGVDPATLNFLRENVRYDNELKAFNTADKDYSYMSKYAVGDMSGYLNPEEIKTFANGLGVAYPLYRDVEGKLKAGDLSQVLAMTNASSNYDLTSRNKVFDFIAGVNNSYKGITSGMQKYTEAKAQGEGLKAQGEGTQEAVNAEMMTRILNDNTLTNDQKIEQLNKLSGKGKSTEKQVEAWYKTYEKLKIDDPALAEKYKACKVNPDSCKSTSFEKDLATIEAKYGSESAQEFAKAKTDTTTQREIEYTTNLADKVDAIAKPTDLSTIANNVNDPRYAGASKAIRELSTALKFNPTDTLSFKISDLSGFAEFSRTLKGLTHKDTGPIDNFINNLMPYIDQTYAKSEAAIKFQQSTIEIGNQMFGATYTPGEMQKYVSGMSSLYQNDKQIKAATKAYLENIIAQAKGMKVAFPDDRIFNWYMQPRIDELQSALKGLDNVSTGKKEGNVKKLTQKEEKIPTYKNAEEIRQANVKAGDKFYFGNVLMEIQLVDGKLVPVKVSK